ncbi:MAG: glutamine synthetase family protein [Burkholderiaceae bacterium]
MQDARREQAVQQVLRRMAEGGIRQVRLAWCDVHGMTRGKTLMPRAVHGALMDGLGMVSTLMLKDSADRTAWKVFEDGGTQGLHGFGAANNLLLLADPGSYDELPWAPGTAWLQCQPWLQDGTPVALDSRRVLQSALARLAGHGLGLVCGLEVEFHIYRIRDASAQLNPDAADWPGPPPEVDLIHPGYQLLGEAWADLSDEPLAIVRETAQGLGLPLLSLEIELGPSQVEAVFAAQDALTAADQMVRFRNGVRQALRRAGYHASFMCRPPFARIMSSGWHLHQSLVDLHSGSSRLRHDAPATAAGPDDARHVLSDTGAHWLAGLLAHARGMAAFCTTTANGYGRFQPHMLAPCAAVWGRDNRGAMLRVVGECGDAATRIENRIGEPAANPYLYMAAQIHAGLDGIERALVPPAATRSPYQAGLPALPASLGEALHALRDDAVLCQAFGAGFIDYYTRIKQAEATRHAAAADARDFDRREYFSRI